MKKQLLGLLPFCFVLSSSFAQMIMTAEGIKADNVCKSNSIYFLMEKKARPAQPIDSIELRLNQAILYAKENPVFQSKPAIQFAVNCKGEVGGGFHMVTKSGNDDLDAKLISFFKGINGWKPGFIRKKAVDSWYMWRLEIKDGYIDIVNI